MQTLKQSVTFANLSSYFISTILQTTSLQSWMKTEQDESVQGW